MNKAALMFTKLVVTDLPRSERFYADVFGLEASGRVSTDEHAYALDEVMMSAGESPKGHTLIITCYRSRPCPPAGAAWTGFLVPDIESTCRAIAKAGGQIEVPVHGNEEFRTLAAIASDPDGHLIEIVQLLNAGTAA